MVSRSLDNHTPISRVHNLRGGWAWGADWVPLSSERRESGVMREGDDYMYVQYMYYCVLPYKVQVANVHVHVH